MADSQSLWGPEPGASSRYRVRLLGDPRVTDGGISHREGDRRQLLAWSEVQGAIAAEVGEPQGVRTVVFDLLVEHEGSDRTVCRLDAEPGEDSIALARAIAEGVGPDRSGGSIKSLATDGSPSRWYPDLEAFEDAAREELRAQGVRGPAKAGEIR